MSKHNKLKASKTTIPYRGMFYAFLAVCVITIVFCFRYYSELHSVIREESKAYLQEVTGRIGANINRIIADNYNVLYTMTAVVEEEQQNNQELQLSDVQPIFQKQQKYWDYENVMFVSEDGKSYDMENKEVFVDIDQNMRQELLDGNQTMSTTQVVNNREYIIFLVPLKDIEMNGKKMIAMGASYDPAEFDQVLSMASFNERAYSQIITKSGTLVTKSTSKYAIKTGYNLFSSLKELEFDKGDSIEAAKKDILKDVGSQIGFTVEGERWYMVYTPIQPDEWYLVTFVPAQVINEKSDLLLRSTLMICALLTITYLVLVITLVYVFSNSRRKLEHMAYVDDVTGGNSIKRFYEIARDRLVEDGRKQHALVYTNIENFKVLNEQLGRQNCDWILQLFDSFINKKLTEKECMGRISADNFSLLLEYKEEEELLSRFESWINEADLYMKEKEMQWGLPCTEFGIYVIENDTLLFPQMLDRAKLALKESPRSVNSKFRYAFYDDKARRQMLREKQLEDMMDAAIEEKEFQVYLQPKYRLPEEKIGGAEALVRWESKTEGMIFPNEFIPLFERNGFIVRLDLYVFEEVCRTIKAWLNRGIEPVKISVNCSRVHFGDMNFLKPYISIAQQYQIDKKYIEIELTESVIFENTKRLIEIIEDIRAAGFGCSMDDFGSGYSSLNLIRSIPVDTLKLDKIFFDGKLSELGRTEAVVESVTTMAKALQMETVAEGVEVVEQVEMLKRVGCNYIQGYVFAKPMKINAFEELAFGSSEQ